MSELPSEAAPVTTTPPSPTTTTTTPVPIPSLDPDEPQGHPMDDLLPGQSQSSPEPSSSPLVFADVPQSSETKAGVSVLLACRAAEPVAECQWSWQPLPPTNLPLPDDESVVAETTATSDVSPSLSTPGLYIFEIIIKVTKNLYLLLNMIIFSNKRKYSEGSAD